MRIIRIIKTAGVILSVIAELIQKDDYRRKR